MPLGQIPCMFNVFKNKLSKELYRYVLITFLVTGLTNSVEAQITLSSAGKAVRMHQRIAGVPPEPAVRDAMSALIESGDEVAAGLLATEHVAFYDTMLRNWITPWSNEEQVVIAEFNDFVATVIGIIRDDIDFREVLYGDILYIGDTSRPPVKTNNNHYRGFGDINLNGLNLRDHLLRKTQSGMYGTPVEATAGVMTTRQGAFAFFEAGTNRAMYRFTQLNFLCKDMEETSDVTTPSHRIRQDVDRAPGQEPEVYLTECAGCHAGLDALAGAFAHYDLKNRPGVSAGSERLTYDPEKVEAKYLINQNVFPEGYQTTDASWINYWREGRNANLGWSSDLPGRGTGAKSLGMELAHSRQFARCQVEKAFELVCINKPESNNDKAAVEVIADNFAASGYNMRRAIAETAAYCSR